MNIKKILIGAVILLITASLVSADWNMFRHDLNRSGYTGESSPLTNNSLWSYNAGGQLVSSPSVSDNMVFFGSWDHKLYALNASPLSMSSSDRLIWSFTAEKPIFSSPAVAEGMVFFSSSREITGVYLNETSGKVKDCNNLLTEQLCFNFSYWCEWDNTECKPTYTGWRQISVIHSVNKSNGDTIWNFSTGGSEGWYSSPAVAQGTIFIGSASVSPAKGRIYALNSSTGELIWNYTIDGADVKSSPAVSDGMVFVGSHADVSYVNPGSTIPGRIYALNASSLQMSPSERLIWNYTTKSLCDEGSGEGQYPCSIFSSPAVFGDMVFFGSNDNHVYALNKSSGNLIWNYSTGDDIRSSPAVAYDMVFIGSMDGKIYALNKSSGNLIWNYSVGAVDIVSSPAVANNIVYIGGGNNNIYVLNASTGKLIWTYVTGAYVDSSPAIVNGAEDGMLFIGSGDNKLYAFGTLYPDLTVTSINIPQDIKDGQIVQINATIANQGEGDAEYEVSFYYDIKAPAYLIDTVVGSIAHFNEENVSVLWDTAGNPGEHIIYAVAAVTSMHADKNNSNNIENETANVSVPDRSLRIIPHRKRVNLNDNFIIFLNISSDITINRAEFNLIFNSSILDLDSADIKEGYFFTNHSHSIINGNLNFTANGSANGTGILAKINFTAKETGLSELNLVNVNFYNTSGPIQGVLPLPVGGEINVCIAGDVDCACENNNYRVDIDDLMIVAQAFNTRAGDGNFDLRADIKQDNIINIFDLAAVGRNFASQRSC